MRRTDKHGLQTQTDDKQYKRTESRRYDRPRPFHKPTICTKKNGNKTRFAFCGNEKITFSSSRQNLSRHYLRHFFVQDYIYETPVTTDHVAAAYKKNTRKNENFIQSNCVMFDVDNTDTDTPGEWITYDTLRADFPNVEYFIVTSRNHMKEKDGNKSVLSGVPASLPSLIKAYRIQDKARNVGFDWDEREQVWDKVKEEIIGGNIVSLLSLR